MKTTAMLRLLPALLVAGCIKMDQELIIKENGSGTLSVTYSVAEQSTSHFQAMQKLRAEMDAARGVTNAATPSRDDLARLLFNPVKEEIVLKLKSYEKGGLVVERVDVKSRDVRRNVEIKVRFDRLEALAQTDIFQLYGFSVRKNDTGGYVFERKPAQDSRTVRTDFNDPETAKMVAPLLAGFAVNIRLSTPGRILQSTGSAGNPYMTEWRFDFDRDVNAVNAFLSQRFAVTFEGQGVKLPEISLSQAPTDDGQPASGAK